ncbi:MAG: histidinol-phosphatase [Spirochaetaceae bacterium]|nr:histidinol-phosphatase [Spirochaetaceae bacterium]
MKLSNLHVHTHFCDGTGTPEDYCRAAVDAGLVSIGFSAHAPLAEKTGLTSDWHLPREQFTAYRDAVLACRAEYAALSPPLPVYLGLEADYISGFQMPRIGGLDYTIGSLHCVVPPDISAAAFFARAGKMLTIDGSPEEWRLLIDEFFGGDVRRLVDAYLREMREMIQEGGFDILGHADLIKKNNNPALAPKKYLFDETDAAYRRGIEGIVRALEGSGIVVEINTGGISRGRTKETYPALDFLRLLRESGIEVAVNGDSHYPEHIAAGYETAVETARAAGYTQTLLFEGRQNGKPVWKPEPLTVEI